MFQKSITITIAIASIVYAQLPATMIGFKGGLISTGTFYVENGRDFEDDSETSYSLGAFIDKQLGEKFYGGIYLDLHDIVYTDENELMLNFGFALKAVLGGNEGELTFRPGLQFGYASIDKIEGISDNTGYLTGGVGLEFIFPSSEKYTFMGELTLYAAPAGGNDDYDVTFGPMLIARGGVYF